ncbi:glucans biosynthesis glucosyltransferase MdoH [Caldimonas sp. KR1-144]|uniref:glucans biosynthesis glucosyltransferase MdoH n=1 Tax=Caldimonas sp. KR1-144 TaxID=3400911 RepID=UPI003C0962D9
MDLRNASPLSVPRASTAPALLRGAMTPRAWHGFWAGLAVALLAALVGRRNATRLDAPWRAAAGRRRALLLALVAGCAALATWLLVPENIADAPPAQIAQDALFALLFAWIAAGCITAVMGWRSLQRGDPHGLSARDLDRQTPLDPAARTAIVMPICNEDIATVFGGLRATIESLQAAPDAALFDVFILSDSHRAGLPEAELAAWRELRAALGEAGERVHYRWRRRRTKRKAGNVMDFCRRWGRAYRYMVVLDADSVMSGEALSGLLRMMEAHPRAGILQTAPRAGGIDTLHARAQAFTGRVTGRLFCAGLAYWQLGESHYWGHNAILRVEPFMRHCALAKLPGRGGLAGEILSHDFVEAALMRRAGYEVWLVGDLDGSYEQQPPHLADELQRDRRWCQGNLQNARLIAEPGFAGVHRAMFLTGALSYLASPLWLAFVLLGALPWLADASATAAPSGAALALWTATLAMLFLPRLLGVLLVLQEGEQRAYGGAWRLAGSAALEAVLSALQAPVRMVAHSLFVLGALTGLKLQWTSPSREAQDIGWRDACARFGVAGALMAGLFAWLLAGRPTQAWRIAPLALPLLLAVPLSVATSRARIGQALRRRGWLLTPEESQTPPVLRAAWHAGSMPPALPDAAQQPPVQAPRVSAVAALPMRRRPALALARRAMVAAGVGAAALTAAALPTGMGDSALTANHLELQRIVLMASSPAAAPRVLGPAPRLQRAKAALRPVPEPARAAAAATAAI